jgi:hypothetical protein
MVPATRKFRAPFVFHRLAVTAAAVMIGVTASVSASALETRSYVMSSFWQAMNTTDKDCPDGLNPKIKEQYEQNLAALGFKPREIASLMEGYVEGEEGGWDKDRVGNLMHYRGRVDGKPVNAFVHPYAVIDPKLKVSQGKLAHGFNLDGQTSDNDFVDPLFNEKGVDHEMARIVGCIEPFRATLKEGSAFWQFMWTAVKGIAPAWTITLSGEDLDQDGPITLTVGRAMEPARYNGNGTARSSMTFRIDPDPRVAKNVYKAEIKDGVINVLEPGPYRNFSDALIFPRFELDNFHARLRVNPDGSLDGLIGGYQPIEHLYFALGNGNLAAENNFSPELPGMYHLMRRYADANPVDGVNMSISIAYYIQAVPAFVLPVTKSAPASAGN